ncbi:hypothetical protein TNCV_3021811 [Trichonephila clavipes]|nr:hypothetical protein TNCV_3021811 [Trichonephila clavipes]
MEKTVLHTTADTDRRRTRSNQSGVLTMSAEMVMIHVRRSFTVATGVSNTSDFMCLQKKKSKRLRSGEHGGQLTGSPRPIHCLEM